MWGCREQFSDLQNRHLNLFWKNVTTKSRWPSWSKAPVSGHRFESWWQYTATPLKTKNSSADPLEHNHFLLLFLLAPSKMPLPQFCFFLLFLCARFNSVFAPSHAQFHFVFAPSRAQFHYVFRFSMCQIPFTKTLHSWLATWQAKILHS